MNGSPFLCDLLNNAQSIDMWCMSNDFNIFLLRDEQVFGFGMRGRVMPDMCVLRCGIFLQKYCDFNFDLIFLFSSIGANVFEGFTFWSVA